MASRTSPQPLGPESLQPLYDGIQSLEGQLWRYWLALVAVSTLYFYYTTYAPIRARVEQARAAALLEEIARDHRQFVSLHDTYIGFVHPQEARDYSTLAYIRVFTDVYEPILRSAGFASASDTLHAALGQLRDLYLRHQEAYCARCRQARDSTAIAPVEAGDVTLMLPLLCQLQQAVVRLERFSLRSDYEDLRSIIVRRLDVSPGMTGNSEARQMLRASILETFAPFNPLRVYNSTFDGTLASYRDLGARAHSADPLATIGDLTALYAKVRDDAERESAHFLPDVVTLPILNLTVDSAFTLIICPILVSVITAALVALSVRRARWRRLLRQSARLATQGTLWLELMGESRSRTGTAGRLRRLLLVAGALAVVSLPLLMSLSASVTAALQGISWAAVVSSGAAMWLLIGTVILLFSLAEGATL